MGKSPPWYFKKSEELGCYFKKYVSFWFIELED